MSGQLALGLKLRDSSVFASYFAGRNQATVDALRAAAIGAPPTCLFLHGPTGGGKTHLLQALCAEASQQGYSVAYLPLADVMSMGPELLSGCGEIACVCIDDVEVIAAQPAWERALFRLHQQLDERQGRLVVSSSRPPAASGIELADLRSRLGGGLVLSLQPLDETEQIAALQLRAQIRGFDLPLDTAQYLLRRLPRDMASLCAFLDELDEASLAAQRRLTVPFVREIVDAR
ncbi:MAG TPA: DnaA regulatory inactivator Hda [Povalibacter sp.]|uniref:DnaA regulatory inactivator Hda n=1 Tax=Povalibacter sp. TaxID=1962978 RepID=UPI002BFF49A3|nr:DnaA regulatory inactivator Hda [Povalibacter sp.]HMN43467.1 DnaA regulatory inactivator Hda [Povalibacter sp.]